MVGLDQFCSKIAFDLKQSISGKELECNLLEDLCVQFFRPLVCHLCCAEELGRNEAKIGVI